VRFRPGTPPHILAWGDQATTEMQAIIRSLISAEALHSLTCTDPDCGGIAFPFVMQINDPRALAMSLAVTVEMIADWAAEQMRADLGPNLPTDPEELTLALTARGWFGDDDGDDLGTSGGVELTEEIIANLVAEAEEGYDPNVLRPRPRSE
jgi:hypothetical protein